MTYTVRLTPKVSILMPLYNGENFLMEAVKSVLAQSERDFELLIGDNGSTDTSRSLLAALGDPRVRVFLNDRNYGIFGNLNLLRHHATAPLIHFLCHDDAMEPDCLANELAYFEAHPEVVMTISAVYQVDETGRVTGEWAIGDGPSRFGTAHCLEKLYYEGCIAGNLSTVCARRDALDAAGPFDDSFIVAGDYEMWVRLCQQGWVADRHDKLIRLRQHSGRLSEASFFGCSFRAGEQEGAGPDFSAAASLDSRAGAAVYVVEPERFRYAPLHAVSAGGAFPAVP